MAVYLFVTCSYLLSLSVSALSSVYRAHVFVYIAHTDYRLHIILDAGNSIGVSFFLVSVFAHSTYCGYANVIFAQTHSQIVSLIQYPHHFRLVYKRKNFAIKKNHFIGVFRLPHALFSWYMQRDNMMNTTDMIH